jgi:hypothetical protein
MARTSMLGERNAMMRATASSEAVSVSIRKAGFTRRRIANLQSNSVQKELREPGYALVVSGR